MLINKLLTRKGWRVVAYSMLAAAGIGLDNRVGAGHIQPRQRVGCALGVIVGSTRRLEKRVRDSGPLCLFGK